MPCQLDRDLGTSLLLSAGVHLLDQLRHPRGPGSRANGPPGHRLPHGDQPGQPPLLAGAQRPGVMYFVYYYIPIFSASWSSDLTPFHSSPGPDGRRRVDPLVHPVRLHGPAGVRRPYEDVLASFTVFGHVSYYYSEADLCRGHRRRQRRAKKEHGREGRRPKVRKGC